MLTPRRTVPAALAITALGLAAAAPSTFARHGADDPAGHDRGTHHSATVRGADDRGGARHRGRHHHRGERHHRGGHDDGPNHR
jgi:Spy/CpxP family protein refolding chaperone